MKSGRNVTFTCTVSDLTQIVTFVWYKVSLVCVFWFNKRVSSGRLNRASELAEATKC